MFKCPICNNSLTYLQSEDYGDTGIIEFYEFENCKKIIALSDIEEEEF